MSELLEIRDLHVYFETPPGTVRANRGVNLEVARGGSLGIMGESGCGKTVLLLTILRLQQPGRIVRGAVKLGSRDITAVSEKEMERLRGRQLGLVPQNHATALNPAYTVRDQLAETIRLRRHGGGLWPTLLRNLPPPDAAARAEIEAAVRDVGFTDDATVHRLLASYPHQLSGGIRQRVLIAMALLLQPSLLIADEPTTALDRATRGRLLELLGRLREKTTLLVVSHDMDTIAGLCDSVAIMYGGRIIERGPTAAVLENPRHPYTRMLVACQRRNRGRPLVISAADTLDLIHFPTGCSFHPTCPEALPECAAHEPGESASGDVIVACHRRAGEAA